MFDVYDLWRRGLFRLGVGEHADFRRQAEEFWRVKQFRKAAACYRLHLELHADDFGSWLNLGFCEAFIGRADQAMAAYRQAAMHAPTTADGLLAIARRRISEGRVLNALTFYRRAFALNPQLALNAEDGLDVGPDFLSASRLDGDEVSRRVFLDITDLLRYFRRHVHGTGIQRVELSLIAAWFRRLQRQGISFVFCRDGRSQIFLIAEEELAALVDAAQDPMVIQAVYQPYLDKIDAEAPPVELRHGDVFMLLGAFWTSIDYTRTFHDLRERGVLIGAYIYDLIPVLHPEFVPTFELNQVCDRFGDVLTEVDFACTISDFVAREVRDFFHDRLALSIPVLAVPLAHDPPRRGRGDVDKVFLKTLPAEYVLCICTIEGRKNQLLLFDVWQQLLAKHGDATPPLIVVGQWGWSSDVFKQRLKDTRSLSGKIIVLGNLTDAKVDHLYRHCLFTVFPSFVEGWGLPVGESLASGTPCIASNTSSIPEVGGDLVRYIDPYDPQGALAVIEKPLMDRVDLAAWKSDVVARFRPRTWHEVLGHFLDQVEACAQAVRPRPAKPIEPLRAGVTYFFNADADGSVASWLDRAHKFVFEKGWYSRESEGAWSAMPVARLSIRTELAPGSRAAVRLFILGAASKSTAQVVLRDVTGGFSIRTAVPTDKTTWIETAAVVDDRRMLVLDLERMDTDFTQADLKRPRYLGLAALMLTLKDVAEADLSGARPGQKTIGV